MFSTHYDSKVLTMPHYAAIPQAMPEEGIDLTQRKITVLLQKHEFDRFDAYCKERGFKKSTLIARLIRVHLDSEANGPAAHRSRQSARRSIDGRITAYVRGFSRLYLREEGCLEGF